MESTRKSNVYCCVPQCSTYYGGGISFHTFPSEPRLKAEWIRKLKIGKKVSPYMRICSKHFTDEDFFFRHQNNNRQRLKQHVIPSMNLPVVSHTKQIDVNMANDRKARVEKRQHNGNDNVEVISKLKDVPEPNEDINGPESRPDQHEVAEILLSLGEPVKPHEKTFEDKGVQVNTLEDFSDYDVGDLINSDYKLKILTGITNLALLNALTAVLLKTVKVNTKMSVKKMILLTMMRIKLDLTFMSLAVLFNVSATTANSYFQITIKHLSCALRGVIRFPPKDEILKNIPSCFRRFHQTRLVLDCTETEIQRSKCLKCRIKSYSFYKGRHTIKFLVGVAPSGLITYLSKGYGGRASDKAIFNEENVISLVEYPDAIMVDKGFMIEKECAENHIKLIRPPFLRKKKQLTRGEALQNTHIARARVHVERSIQRIKTFRVCRNVIPWLLLPFIDDIFTSVVALVNLSNPILAQNKFC